MAKNTSIKGKTVSKSSDIGSLIKRNEFVIGFITIVILVALGGIALKNLSSKHNLSRVPAKQELKTIGTSVEIGPSATPVAPKVKQMKNITQLSNTSSFDYVKIKNGDSYYKITKNYCGAGNNYLLIADLNNNAPLYAGDSVKVSCSF